ncbi:hypothetical protein R84B8_00497 [Treponema sp. R8-4-B8]
MALSALNVLSGIAAAAAGLAGEKVSKDGAVPGLDLAAIIPALLGKSGGIAGIAGGALAAVAKTGLLNNSKLGNLAELAGSLFSFGKADTTQKTTGGIAGLASAIIGNSGGGALASIATMASGLAKSAKNEKEVTGMASELGKTLSSSFGVSFDGGGTAIKALDKVMGNDTKGDLFKAILKGLV